jgi:hypothetical protein
MSQLDSKMARATNLILNFISLFPNAVRLVAFMEHDYAVMQFEVPTWRKED